ncbi:hypothetical protein E2C01_063005 [Portunus trituberculatus]|uniref:Uncharacterized protein n=1 Tax=Portunus trituberculatus TaxID=210409 RepID=A0A5B7HGX7_PORTR|nr:hypothetical protein [Portunus trituberculatus]
MTTGKEWHRAANDGKNHTERQHERSKSPSDSHQDTAVASGGSLRLTERIRILSLRYYPRILTVSPAVREFNEPQTSMNGASRIPGMCGVCGGRHGP